MKPKIFLTAFLLIVLSLAAFAQANKTTRLTIPLHEAITSLSVDDHLDVVLVAGTAQEITVEGNARAVIAKIFDGHLYLSSRNGFAALDTKVYLPAALLSSVYLYTNGTLGSASPLSNARLKIFVGNEAKVRVKSTGSVTVETSDDMSFIKGE